MIHRRLGYIGCFIVAAGLLCAGCASHWPEVDPKIQAPAQTYQMPPKEILQRVKEIVSSPPLSIGVTEEKDGSILTGYQEFPGDWHVLRRWQERTRYRITVSPDWSNPSGAGRIEVRELTEQRAADGMEWHPAPELQRPERARQMLATLDEQLRAKPHS